MTSILYDATTVNVSLADKVISAPSLTKTLIFDPSLTGTITNLTEEFTSLDDLSVKFDNTTKLYKAASAHYSQQNHQSALKVGRVTAGDANISASLDALYEQDKDFFCLLTTTKDETEIDEIADWASSKDIIFGFSVEPDSDKLDSASSTDIASTLADLNYNNVFAICHHESGVDGTSVTATIASNVVTVDSTSHSLRVGDDITISGHSSIGANGNFVVASVPDDDSFTYEVTGFDDDEVGEPVDYFARYKFIEAGLQGLQFGNLIGTSSWAYKTITGQSAMPTTLYSASEVQKLRDKKYITYVEGQNNINVTSDGFMVTGRQIVDETVRVWIEKNIASEIFNIQVNNQKIPYTNKGFSLIRKAIAKVLNIQLGRTGLSAYSDTENFQISIPDAITDATTSQRQQGIVPAISVNARIGSSALKITVNARLIV